ncbi:hypothetical protein [Polycladidibacter hongkongensis]|uniref:hypothetical protein n=1 Tax=Polycladidibacter hongkongensis TaxID=1647556 RepID=UPI00082CA4C4|nr:hypothetical protein [Pseudovibrio hongkongensis]
MLTSSINELTWHFLGYLRLIQSEAPQTVNYEEGAIQAGISLEVGSETAAESAFGTSPHQDVVAPLAHMEAAIPLTHAVTGKTIGIQQQEAASLPSIKEEGEVNISDPVGFDQVVVPTQTIFSITVSAYYNLQETMSQQVFAEQGNVIVDDDLLVSQGRTIEKTITAKQIYEDVSALSQSIEYLPFGDVGAATAMTAQQKLVTIASQVTGRVEAGKANKKSIELTRESGDESGALNLQQSNISTPDQYIDLGNNETLNTASIVDLGLVKAGVSVLGDYYNSDIIVQTNISCHSNASSEVASIASQLSNEALFSREAGEVSPTLFSGGMGHANFIVDYVMGDVTKLNHLQQYNFIQDNDCISFELSRENTSVSLGDNAQVNAGQIVDHFQAYDMIIVLGDYYDLNFISQSNVLLDNNYVSASGGWQSSTGNIIENEAHIKSYGGGQLLKDMPGHIRHMASELSAFSESFSIETSLIESGLPYSLGSDFNLLVVAGDFYKMNAVTQLNIVSDVDQGALGVSQKMLLGADGSRVINANGNVLKNSAVIVDNDSQSNFQYVDGAYTEEELYVNVNISGGEVCDVLEQVKAATGFVSELVAFVDAPSQQSTNLSECEADIGNTSSFMDILS